MSRKSLITIAAGILILVLTIVSFNALIKATMPTDAETQANTATAQDSFETINQKQENLLHLMARERQAETYRTILNFLVAVEVIGTGVLAYKWRPSDPLQGWG